MKRLLVRLSVVSVLGGLGYYAVAQAKNDTTPHADAQETTSGTPSATPSAAVRPSETAQPTTDPMAITVRTEEPLDMIARPTSPPRELPVTNDLADANPLRPAPTSPLGDRYATVPASASEPVPAAPGRPDPFGLVAGTGSNSRAQSERAAPRPFKPSASSQTDRYAAIEGSNVSDPKPTPTTPRGFPAAIPARPTPTFPDANTARPAAAPRAMDSTFPAASARSDTPRTTPQPSRANGRPGNTNLEGLQSPSLTLEKSAPEEIQVGKATKFQVIVRNTGTAIAMDVQVRDKIPRGTRLLGTKPQATTGPDGNLVWNVGTIEPDGEKVLEMQLMPVDEGEIGSVASVTFRADVSVRTIATRPDLRVVVSGPPKTMSGDNVTLSIQITNAGTGSADSVILYSTLPPELQHSSGAELEFEIGTLRPNETRDIKLHLTAARPGRVQSTISARGEGSAEAVGELGLEVIAPAIAITIDGPRRRYLERPATYTLSVTNGGTATAKDVELVSHLPNGMKFVSANNSGHYDPKSHAVFWSLSELPEGESGRVKLVAMPVEAGQHTLRVEGTADRDLSDSREATVLVEGVAALLFEVVDVEDPVEVGGETTYEIRVLNQGTKTAGNIRVVATFPQQLKPLSAEGPTRNVIDGNRVIFEALPRLAPKADTTFKIRAQGIEAGDQRIRVQVQSDDMDSPVTKEESTRVYADR